MPSYHPSAADATTAAMPYVMLPSGPRLPVTVWGACGAHCGAPSAVRGRVWQQGPRPTQALFPGQERLRLARGWAPTGMGSNGEEGDSSNEPGGGRRGQKEGTFQGVGQVTATTSDKPGAPVWQPVFAFVDFLKTQDEPKPCVNFCC